MARTSPPQFPETVKEGLEFRNVDDLKKLLKLLPIQEKPTRKAQFVDAIANYLLGPNLKQLWEELDELQQTAVAEAIYVTEGWYQPEQFRAKYGALPQWYQGASMLDRYNQPPAKLELFFYPIMNNYARSNYLPKDLQLKLRKFVPKPKPLTLLSIAEPAQTFQVKCHHFNYKTGERIDTVEEVPVVCRLTEQAAQQELLAILRLIHLGKVTVSDKTLMPTKTTLEKITELLQGGDYYSQADERDENYDDYCDPIGLIKPFAWVMLLQGSGLASVSGKKLQLTKAGQKAMSGVPVSTLKSIWKKWLKTNIIDELRRVESIKGQTGKGKYGLTAVSGRRLHIANMLCKCPVGEWVEFSQLKRYMIASDQTFEVSRNPENLYFSEPGYGYLYEAVGSWSVLQDGYMKCFLFEYAATLGLLDVAYITPYDFPKDDLRDFWGTDYLSFLSRYDGLLAFRITALGAFCLELTDTYTGTSITTETTLRVLPNLDIVVTGVPLNSRELLMMETFTAKTGDAVWKLDRDVVLKAVETGHSLQDFYEFLTQASHEALPKTVEQFFVDCRSRCESLKDRGVARLIECTDATLAAQIAHDSRTKKYCQLVGEKSLVVLLEEETRFRNGLRKLGYILPLNNG